jgi:hypothetical protein
MAAASARLPTHAGLIASAITLAAVAGFDPLNDGGEGLQHARVVQASYQLASYGALPFLACSVVLPHFGVLVIAMLGHSVRAAQPPHWRGNVALRAPPHAPAPALVRAASRPALFLCSPPKIRAIICLPSTSAALVVLVSAIAVMQEYTRQRAMMQQFLVALALERSQRELERRRVAHEAAARFEQTFGYICEDAAGILCRVCVCVCVRGVSRASSTHDACRPRAP